MEDFQRHSRKRKASDSSKHESLHAHDNSSASHFPLRVLHSSPPQASSSPSIPSQLSSLAAMYNRIQPRDATQSPRFPWNQQLQPLASSSSHGPVAVAVTDQQQPAQQRERTSRYLSEGDRRTIISRIEHGEKQVTLAKEYNVSRAAICNLYKNRKEVLTRVDRDPEAKHPKKQRPKKTPATMTGDESPSPSVAAVTASPLSSPADEDVDGEPGVDDGDEAEEKIAVKTEPEDRFQQQKRLGRATATTTTTSMIMRTERALATEDFSGPMETVLLPHSASFSSLSSSASSRSASVTRESPQSSSSASLEQHRRIKPFLVHEASVYSLPIKKLLSSLRNAETRGGMFRHHTNRVTRLLVEEALGCLPQRDTDILTPYGDAIPGIIPTDEREVCAISMEAVGEQQPPVLLRAFADVQPLSSTGVLTLTPVHSASDDMAGRYEERSTDWRVHARLPPVHRDQVVLLLDLVCGTGERACSALGYLVHEARIAPSSIYFVTVNGAIQGLQRVHHYFPDVSLITAQMDKVVDAQRRIRPGVGNFLERYWDTSHCQQQQHMDAPRYMHHER